MIERRFFSQDEKRIALERQEYMCGECGADLWREPIGANQGHHILPYGMGGETTIDNLIVLCPTCHKYHDELALCGVMYGGYGITDMEEEQIRDPYKYRKAIPETKRHKAEEETGKRITKLRGRIYERIHDRAA